MILGKPFLLFSRSARFSLHKLLLAFKTLSSGLIVVYSNRIFMVDLAQELHSVMLVYFLQSHPGSSSFEVKSSLGLDLMIFC